MKQLKIVLQKTVKFHLILRRKNFLAYIPKKSLIKKFSYEQNLNIHHKIYYDGYAFCNFFNATKCRSSA